MIPEGASQPVLILDFETRSEAPLKEVGAYEYAADPSTQILCASFIACLDGGRDSAKVETVRRWDRRRENSDLLLKLEAWLKHGKVMVVAHNAFFEWCIIRHRLGIDIPERRLTCTAALAAAMALPRSLDGAAAALGLAEQKDKAGHRLMLKLSKPRRPTQSSAARWHEDPTELERLVSYCETDVRVTRDLYLGLPPLNAMERQVWELDQKINRRGFAVDRDLVLKIQKMIALESVALTSELAALTSGAVQSAKQTATLKTWLAGNGLPDLLNLQAKTIDDALDGGGLPPLPRRAFEIRQLSSKTSNAKYRSFELRSRFDGRCRESLIYHGAATGRWVGAGVQPQNLPRSTLNNTDLAAGICATGELEVVKMFYDKPLEVFSSVLRSAIVPESGSVFYCADYAAVEMRVVFWLANHQAGLAAIREGQDLYKLMAADIYGVPVTAVTADQRQLGKAAVLGCGFGMGAAKFFVTCKNWRLDVSEELAARAVKTYRQKHRPVTTFWKDVERATLDAVTFPGKTFTAGRVQFFKVGRVLFCRLPSGRRLSYFDPVIKTENALDLYGIKGFSGKPRLTYYCVNGITRKWASEETYGGALVENVTQAVARDLMAWAMVALDQAGFSIVLSVHDEVLVEEKDDKRFSEFLAIMSKPPEWADGLPVKATGWCGPRYCK